MTRLNWIDSTDTVALTRQCELAGVARSTVYAHQQVRPMPTEDVALSHLLDELYTAHPFFGTRRMVVALRQRGHTVNRNRVQRLMRNMGLAGMAPGPNTSQVHPGHKIYPGNPPIYKRGDK